MFKKSSQKILKYVMKSVLLQTMIKVDMCVVTSSFHVLKVFSKTKGTELQFIRRCIRTKFNVYISPEGI